MADMEFVILHPVGQLFQSQTLVPLFTGIPYQKTLTQSGAAAVHDIDLSVRIFLPQLFGCDDCGLIGGREGRGKTKYQQVLAFLQHRLHDLDPALRIGGGGGGGDAGAESVIEFLDAFLVGKIIVRLPLINHGQGDTKHIVFLILLCGEVAAGIGNDLISCHILYAPENHTGQLPLPGI